MKPATTVNIGEKAERQSALSRQKEIDALKTPQFRARVQRDVKALNQRKWKRWTIAERNKAMKDEAEKRVRILFPTAQGGTVNGVDGWFVMKGGKPELVAPWITNENIKEVGKH